MGKIMKCLLLVGTFFFGFILTNNLTGISSAASKFCDVYSSWTSCYNYTANTELDWNVARTDTARSDGPYYIDVSSTKYDVGVYAPENGGGSFFTGHWIYVPQSGELYKNPDIDYRYLTDGVFYISNASTGGSVQYYDGEEPEITTQIRNGGSYNGNTYIVTALRQ
ncbi:hypothetical protein [Halobacillus hunanensis]|uniref:hypothetical protein n=1 Tax=Halobacillus hunanensis TaxID=578214 RepID=UPI0009A6CD2F|nr:hypothetical protein [Halobacillus hunanensis]